MDGKIEYSCLWVCRYIIHLFCFFERDHKMLITFDEEDTFYCSKFCLFFQNILGFMIVGPFVEPVHKWEIPATNKTTGFTVWPHGVVQLDLVGYVDILQRGRLQTKHHGFYQWKYRSRYVGKAQLLDVEYLSNQRKKWLHFRDDH